MKYFYLTLCLLFIPFLSYSKDFQFAVLTDTHLSRSNPSPETDLIKCIEDINKCPDVRFVLVTGDITEQGDRQSLQRAKDLLDELHVPYYAIPGNHETKWSESGLTAFGKIYGSERFQFEYEGFHFFGFNSGPVIRMMDGHVAPQDIYWLQDELAKLPKNQPTIMVTHYPIQTGDVDNWYEVTDAVRPYNIRAFIGGHYHQNRLLNYEDIPAFLCRSSLHDKEDQTSGYTIFHVTNDSILSYEKKVNTAPVQWGGYDLHHTYFKADNTSYPRPDYTVNDTYPNVEMVWSQNIKNAIYSSPIVDKNKIYLGDDSGIFYCLSANNGEIIWQYQTGNRIVGTAAVAKGVVVFGSADHSIYGLNASTGQLLWKVDAEEPVLGSAAIHKHTAYIGASDHTFRAIDIRNGQLLWTYNDIQGYMESRPFIYKDQVYFGAWDENMYALNTKDGTLRWKWAEGRSGMLYSPAAVWPVATNGKLFFSAPDRFLNAVDITSGKTVWRTSQSVVRETVGLSEDRKRVYSKTMQDSVVCYSATAPTAERLWSTHVGYGYDHAPSMPVEKKGIVFGSTKNGLIFSLDGKTGQLLWIHKYGNSIINTVFPLNQQECIFSSGEGVIGRIKYKK